MPSCFTVSIQVVACMLSVRGCGGAKEKRHVVGAAPNKGPRGLVAMEIVVVEMIVCEAISLR